MHCDTCPFTSPDPVAIRGHEAGPSSGRGWLGRGESHRMSDDGRDCPEWCAHDGACAEARSGIHAMEALAEGAWLRAAEAGYPGYDYDPNDAEATDR